MGQTQLRAMLITAAGLAVVGCRFDPSGMSIRVAGTDDTGAASGDEILRKDASPESQAPLDLASSAPWDGNAAQEGDPSYTLSNIPSDFLTLGTKDLLLAAGARVSITTSTKSMLPDLTAPGIGLHYDASGDYTVLVVRNLIIEEGASLRARGHRPLIVAASGDVVVDGFLSVSANGPKPGAGGRKQA